MSGRVKVALQYRASPPTLVDGDATPPLCDAVGSTLVSASSLPLPAGAATEATLAAMNAKIPGPLGAKTIANAMAVSIASDQTVPVSAAALPLPTGAATEATLTAVGLILSSMDAKLPATLGQKAMATSLAVVVASDQSPIPVAVAGGSTVATSARLAASASSQVLFAAATTRRGGTIYNDSAATLYVLLSATGAASTTNFTVVLAPLTNGIGGYYELPFGYTGDVQAISSSATGAVQITDFA